MRSQTVYIITKAEGVETANLWLTQALKLNYVGIKCSTSLVFQVLLLAAANRNMAQENAFQLCFTTCPSE